MFKKSAPVAERLIFRHLARQIKVNITPNKESFKPNQKLEFKVKTTNEFDEPVTAMLAVTVADDAILEMVEVTNNGTQFVTRFSFCNNCSW